jgi:hypothetical protein
VFHPLTNVKDPNETRLTIPYANVTAGAAARAHRHEPAHGGSAPHGGEWFHPKALNTFKDPIETLTDPASHEQNACAPEA